MLHCYHHVEFEVMIVVVLALVDDEIVDDGVVVAAAVADIEYGLVVTNYYY